MLPTQIQLRGNAAVVLCAPCVAADLGSWTSCPGFGPAYPLTCSDSMDTSEMELRGYDHFPKKENKDE